jgi:hypothetical protein
MTTRRNFAAAAAFLAVAIPLFSFSPMVGAEQDKPHLMFVQTADDIKADDKILRLVNVGYQTLYFSDRPVRIAGHVPLSAYLDEWKASAGPNDFADDPPNATLSVYEGGSSENTLAVVEISHPVVEGNDLVYEYKLIEGAMPKAGGPTALFIDWIGVGGGVGFGFHGIGVGARGPGVTFHGVGVGFRGPGWR